MNTSTRALTPLWRASLSPLSRQAAVTPPTIFARTLQRSFVSTTRPVSRSKPTLPSFQQTASSLLRGQRTCLPRRSVRFQSQKKPSQSPDPTPHLGSPEPVLSLSQRLKKLGKQYGWLALGVYSFLTVLDFPFCFMTVRLLGPERIGHYEHVIVEGAKKILRIPFPNLWKESESSSQEDVLEAAAREGSPEGSATTTGRAEASLWTQLVLAYAVHKSLIFIRIPLTAALLPKVAKQLRAWGYNVGKAKPT
ncbi:unnamed protein product [Periconia digitata]|uniref:DUF1279 domain-containing protein n=1 Tax=Periconia digitata TaxID=1303443 RepID=A0A9W4ULI9_9PLEO|nr:unnamed protein product [Periconia digitata]